MQVTLSHSAKNVGRKFKSMSEIGTLLALMFKYSCEHSKLCVFNGSDTFKDVELEQGTILDNMNSVLQLGQLHIGKTSSPLEVFYEALNDRLNFDNLIILGNGSFHNEFLKSFLRQYRASVNEKLLFVNVDLLSSTTGLGSSVEFDHENDVTLCGFSDSILRFVAERGNQGQLIHIEHIDRTYDLPQPKNLKKEANKSVLPLKVDRPVLKLRCSRWKTLKVFVSSTFRDMHGERDVLSQRVFPMLRAQLSSRLINVHEVDLRWGITEAESTQALGLCLSQVLAADYFIGMLGERYGHAPSDYSSSISSDPRLNWLHSYPANASITELEIQCQIEKKQKDQYERAFFYFRDAAVLEQIPDEYKDNFVSESQIAAEKSRNLKSNVKSRPFEVFQDYPSRWGCYEGGRALLNDLDDFAKRVFLNLFNAITRHADSQESDGDELDELSHLVRVNEAHVVAQAERFVGRAKLVTKLDKLIEELDFKKFSNASSEAAKKIAIEHNSTLSIALLSGEAGCGKSVLISHYFTRHLRSINERLANNSFIYSVGSFSGSKLPIVFLKCITAQIGSNYSVLENNERKTLLDSGDFNECKEIFDAVLERLNALFTGEKLILVVDGADEFLDENGKADDSLSWLRAETVPPFVVVVLVAKSGANVKTALSKMSKQDGKNKVRVVGLEFEGLDVLDKAEVVRAKLAQFNKKLDETAFNNQMKLVTGKRDAISPFYLQLVCEELRIHGHFETLTKKIRELPAKTNQLITFAFDRLCTEFTTEFVNVAFLFINCAKDGAVLEREFTGLLNFYFNAERKGFLTKITETDSIFSLDYDFIRQSNRRDPRISTQKILSFIEQVSATFLEPRAGSNLDQQSGLRLKPHPLVITQLKSKIFNSTISTSLIHRLMAVYYWKLADPQFNLSWQASHEERAFASLPFHLNAGECERDLETVLCDLRFLAVKSQLGLSSQLLADFNNQPASNQKNAKLTKNRHGEKKIKTTARFEEYKSFVNSNEHFFSSGADAVYQQAINEKENSAPFHDLKNILSSNDEQLRLFERLNKQSDEVEKPSSLREFKESVSAVAFSANSQQIACGTEDGEVKLFSSRTAEFVRAFQGHSGRINSLCFVNSDVLCSASSDGMASLWQVNQGFRIKVLNKHNEHVVSGVSAEPRGKLLVTVGWDCSAKIWSSEDGSLQGELKGHPRPVNCVAFEPEGSMLATGCWDSAIRIFHFFDRVRKAVLRGHRSSVRSLAYSASGVYLASAAMDGEVKLWSARNGSQVASLKGHSEPVNSLCFSMKSQFLITGSNDRRVKVWSGNVGKMIRVINDGENYDPIVSVCFEPNNGSAIAVGTHSGELRFYDTFTGELKWRVRGHKAFVRKLKFTPKGSLLISAANDGTMRVIKPDGKIVASLTGNTQSVNALTINSSNVAVTGSEDAQICIYTKLSYLIYENNQDLSSSDEEMFDMFSEEEPIERNLPMKKKVKVTMSNGLRQIEPIHLHHGVHKSAITGCAFNSLGDKFASSSKDGALVIWQLDHRTYQAEPIVNIDAAHSDWITDLQWSSSSNFILTASNDYTLKIWSGEDGKLKNTLTGHTANINACAFQYGCAVSACFDGSVKIWSHKGHEIASLTGHQKRVNDCDLFVKIKTKNQVDEDELENWADRVDNDAWKASHNKSRMNKEDFTVDKVFMVSVSDDATIRLWMPIESEALLSLESHNEPVNTVSLSDDAFLATGSNDKSVNLYSMQDFFKKVQSGKFVQNEKLRSNHSSLVTSILVFKKGQFVVSSYLDGMILLWKFDENMAGFKLVDEIQAHEKACSQMSVLSEKEDSVKFVSSSFDKSLKLWRLEGERVKCEKVVGTSGEVYGVAIVEKRNKKLVISVEIYNQTLVVNYFDEGLKKMQGCLIMHEFRDVIQRVRCGKKSLLIALADSKVIRVELDAVLEKHLRVNLKYDRTNVCEVIACDSAENTGCTVNWFMSVLEDGDEVLAGNWKGDLYARKSGGEFEVKKKAAHSMGITEILSFKSVGDEERLLTASHDGTVKVWSNGGEFQIGQYNNMAGITTVAKFNQNTFVFGDKMGYLHLVRWHDYE